MSELDELRNQIDRIDQNIQSLFEERMLLSEAVAAYKASSGMPVFDAEREKALLKKLRERARDAQAADAAEELYEAILSISRKRQEEILRKG